MSIQRSPAEFELVREGDVWVATHVETEVASEGDSPNEAVAMADEAARLHLDSYETGDDDHQRDMLERFDIDPDEVRESIETPDGVP